MGDIDVSPVLEEDVRRDVGNDTSQVERLEEAPPARAVLPRGIIHSKFNPFVLCSVLSQRSRQLAIRYPGKPFSQVIKITMAEFREGKFQYVIPQFSPQQTRQRK